VVYLCEAEGVETGKVEKGEKTGGGGGMEAHISRYKAYRKKSRVVREALVAPFHWYEKRRTGTSVNSVVGRRRNERKREGGGWMSLNVRQSQYRCVTVKAA